MDPQRLQELRNYYKTRRHLSPPEQDVADLLTHLGLVETELNLRKIHVHSLQAIAWDAGAQAGLDWDKNYPANIRDSNPYKEDPHA